MREGPQGTVVTVKSKQEAHDLLMEAFPDAQKVRGIGSQDAAGIRKNIRWNNLRKEMVLSVIGKITLLILILVVYMVMMTIKAQGMVLCLI
ncbi:conserved hypothetical protein [Escherichia coli TA280]|nr:conserved hypothetical protein [Escherichia coli TA280]